MHDEGVPIQELSNAYPDYGDGTRSNTADARLSLLFAERLGARRQVDASHPPPMILLRSTPSCSRSFGPYSLIALQTDWPYIASTQAHSRDPET